MKWQLERILRRNASHHEVMNIKLEEIETNPYQPRRSFDEVELRDLARSIQEYGVIQPIIVRRRDNRFQLVAGERRLRACKMAGRQEVPALVYEIDDEKAAAVSLVENLQRKDLNYFEEAQAYALLLGEFGMTQEELARRLGKSQSAIANKLRLLRLPEEIREMVAVDVISERHARALLKLEKAELQAAVLKEIYEKDLNVKETEALIEKMRQNISREIKEREPRQNVSVVIRDARIFLNTIKETVARAKQAGINMVMLENDGEEEYELVIRITKNRGRGVVAP